MIFSLYIAVSGIRHMYFLFFVYTYIVSCYISITFVNILLSTFWLLSLNLDNVGECCKAQ